MSPCYPWFHEKFSPLAAEGWTKAIIPSGCSIDATGNVPCSPESMQASAQAWLSANAPQALMMIGGSLSQLVYTFARYMHSEVGSGTVEERVAVGEAAVNQAVRRAGVVGNWTSKLNQMLIPNGMYGAIHAPDAYCASIGKPPRCNAANRWAATSRDPSIMSLLLAHLVASGASGNFSNGAETQWGPDAFKFSDGSKIDSPTQVARFVKAVASQGYYWVGPLAGVDPWHTFLVKKSSSLLAGATMALAADHLPLAGSRPIRPDWGDLPLCGRPLLSHLSPRGKSFLVVSLGLAAGAGIASLVSRRYLHPR
jgi:hypothetical protein